MIQIICNGIYRLLDIHLHPRYPAEPYIYLTYTTKVQASPSGGVNTRVSRFRFDGQRLSAEKILVQGAYGTDGAHFGSRLSFDEDENLFITLGERHNKEKAQDLSYLNGKVLRLRADGSIPQDNPFYNMAGARKEIWTLGHRNPQGIDIHPQTGQVVVSEHGPSGYDANLPGVGAVGRADEVNILYKGSNYGWPILFGDPGILPWTEAMKEFAQRPGVVAPLIEFTIPDGIAPAGAVFYTGSKFPNWTGNFFVAALRGYIVRLRMDESGNLLEKETILRTGFHRLRDIHSGSDGYLYALTANKLIRLKPE